MEAKEKAKELINKFGKITNHGMHDPISKEASIDAAIIHVNNMIKEWSEWGDPNLIKISHDRIKHWEEVKKEVEGYGKD